MPPLLRDNKWTIVSEKKLSVLINDGYKLCTNSRVQALPCMLKITQPRALLITAIACYNTYWVCQVKINLISQLGLLSLFTQNSFFSCCFPCFIQSLWYWYNEVSKRFKGFILGDENTAMGYFPNYYKWLQYVVPPLLWETPLVRDNLIHHQKMHAPNHSIHKQPRIWPMYAST